MAGSVDALREAVESVREIGLDPDSPGGAVALRFVLEGAGSGAAAAPPRPPAPGTAPVDQAPEALVAAWVGVDVERLLDILEFTPDGVVLRVPAARLRRSKAERQRLLTLLKLALDRKAYGAEDVSAQRVNDICSDYNCTDQNFSGNLATREDLIMRRGKRGAYTYRPTQPGIERARTLLLELLEGSGELVV